MLDVFLPAGPFTLALVMLFIAPYELLTFVWRFAYIMAIVAIILWLWLLATALAALGALWVIAMMVLMRYTIIRYRTISRFKTTYKNERSKYVGQ